MKRILFILLATLSTAVCSAGTNAMSNSKVRKETRFLTDKMAYELNLNTEQYNDVYEINLYTRICAICQPLSILQWQLTSDYSLLWGDGIYGSKGPLRPTQRFWNIKQLASTPADALAIPVRSGKKNVNCAAFGNMVRGEYAVHMVNNGAECEAVISGIPAEVKELKVYVTNTKDCMKETAVKVENGQVRVHLPAISFITLLSDK